MSALSKLEMALSLCDGDLSKKEAQILVDHFFDEMIQALVAGEPILLSGFGRFTLRDKGARIGRNPRTKAPVMITPRRVVLFKASGKLKSSIASAAE